MAKINIIVSKLQKDKFSGGIWCIFEYAHGLKKLGHEVNVIPLYPSEFPAWFGRDYGNLIFEPKKALFWKSMRSFFVLQKETFRYIVKRDKQGLRSKTQDFSGHLSSLDPRFLPYELQRAAAIFKAKENIPDADVTLATSFDTALPVRLYGKGALYYFMQHFEPFFKDESSNPYLAEKEALLSYHLGLRMIANSSWLKKQVEQETRQLVVTTCPNAIDHSVFYGKPKPLSNPKELTIISYGGRNAEWKGFRQMAEGVRMARERLIGIKLRWLVYGDSLLPPENNIAPYESLGFLKPRQLSEAYRNADLLLSASWYESFPLFPLEAMACGLPVITTQYGTEEYAVHQDTAEIVTPKYPQSVCDGLCNLITNQPYREKIALRGNAISKLFNWQKSVAVMAQSILKESESQAV